MQIGKKLLAAFLVIIGSTAVMWFAWMVFLPKEPCRYTVPAYVETLSKVEQQKYLAALRESCSENGQDTNN